MSAKKAEETVKEKMKVWEIYAQKLAEIEVKRQLEQHYSPLFEKYTNLFEKDIALLEGIAKNLAEFEKKLSTIEKQVQDLHSRVFGKKPEIYTA